MSIQSLVVVVLTFFDLILQMIHFITMALGGDGYLNFMGNEVRHSILPWIAFSMNLEVRVVVGLEYSAVCQSVQ